ncbi:MAG TPA: PEP-CTERM sorting domain-containing protein [Caulobacteraceae bacterium]|jgi:hypothetical protein|nr:PEP-CTERM sorting domain-containing protein [Caulobacteraceae bacterium]
MKSANFLAAAAVALAAGSAGASTIYSNGPYNGQVDAFTINFGISAADSFTGSGVATGANFVSWNFVGDTPESVDWEITSGNPLSGGGFTVLGSGTATIGSSLIAGSPNKYGYDLYSDTISFSGVTLAGGDYWFVLSNATDTGGDPMYWDDNNGPSSAWSSIFGDLTNDSNAFDPGSNSEAFSILGGGAPEPATWDLVLAGFAGLGSALRLRRTRPAAV